MTPQEPSYRTIPLTQGYEAIVDESDYEGLSRFRWWPYKAKFRDTGVIRTVYAYHRIDRKWIVKMHRVIMGVTDPEVLVDHRNHNGLDNRRGNLRATDRFGNNRNQRLSRANTSGFKGVWKLPNGLFVAQICCKINGVKKTTRLGVFDRAEDAAHAYDGAAISRWGEFAHPNFPQVSL